MTNCVLSSMSQTMMIALHKGRVAVYSFLLADRIQTEINEKQRASCRYSVQFHKSQKLKRRLPYAINKVQSLKTMERITQNRDIPCD